DSWDRVAAMPGGSLRKLAEWTYSAMIYETAWHDEDANPDLYQSRNYQVTFDRNDSGVFSLADTTYDPVSYWALRLHGHVRKVGIMADAAAWEQQIRNGTQTATTVVEAKDVDDDTQDEYILRNNRVYLCFERWGGRLVYAFAYDPDTQTVAQVIGVPVSNPAEEHDGEGADNNRCSAFKDRYTTGYNDHRHVDMDYAATAPILGPDFLEFRSADGAISKKVRLPHGRDVARAEYMLGPGVGTLYLRHGFGPNQMDLLLNGVANLSVESDNFYYGLRNAAGGAVYAVLGRNAARSSGSLPGAGYRNRQLPLAEQVEISNRDGITSFSTSLAFSKASAEDIDGDGLPNAEEAINSADFDNPDSDADGMPDGFEVTHGFAPDDPQDAARDSDADGQVNLAESVAGTDPRNAASVLRVISTLFDREKNEVSIAWSSVPGRQYTLQYKASLGDQGWDDVGSHTATGDTSSLTVAGQGGTRGFYRVLVGN
ncbi:MAG: hypothetical protein ACO3RX_08435, partial [Chthoniobacterales bacterium]